MRIAVAALAALVTFVAGVVANSGSVRPDGTRAFTAERAETVRTPAAPRYTVELAGDATGSRWTGHERVGFTNVSAAPLGEVYLRLWGNAHGTCSAPPIVVSEVTGGVPAGLSVGCTALRIVLGKPLRRGEDATIGFRLRIRVPAGIDRFGHGGGHAFLGNALPVLAVRDGTGRHLDPYTNTGESFYSLAADFDVTLDHPSNLGVPATGTSVDRPGAPGRTVTTATARDVRDFAWAAGPFTGISGTSSTGVRINVFTAGDVEPIDARAMLDVARTAVDAHAGRFGAYPHTELDVVLDDNLWFSGMEYPGFVLDRVRPTALVHELAHQWWYGIVGNDEYGDPWLDESFAEYATDLALGKTGEGCGSDLAWAAPTERITNSMRYWDAHPARYETVVYDYGKCALHELRRLIGEPAMETLLRDYATTHRYGISTTADFKTAARAATVRDLTPFWAQYRIDG
ncbi:M1 family metallopeptidase [Embleya hyalina]|uniref:Peptidase n=1 Tax=Embleya hyalina TaxID=516124 RepID=A0A401YM32_9ACTN|nr:M1 family metallopeptidase [Embleya hyalina]GCD95672.1 peptidase [Embleya hyalina]